MQRLKCADLERQLKEMQTEIQKSSIEVDHELSEDIVTIVGQSDDVTPFMSLFWQQQKKLFSSTKTGVKYHNGGKAAFLLLLDISSLALTYHYYWLS